jgi:HPt (histidine-containing phosphotransfer) domain-containing protein
MRRAAAEGDDAAFKREAHAIKGGCGMVGALELQKLATSMEQRGLRDDDVATLDEFLVACERLRRMLIAHTSISIGTAECQEKMRDEGSHEEV